MFAIALRFNKLYNGIIKRGQGPFMRPMWWRKRDMKGAEAIIVIRTSAGAAFISPNPAHSTSSWPQRLPLTADAAFECPDRNAIALRPDDGGMSTSLSAEHIDYRSITAKTFGRT
jgi:hypothetical protein